MPYQYGIEAKVGNVSVKIPKLKKKFSYHRTCGGRLIFGELKRNRSFHNG